MALVRLEDIIDVEVFNSLPGDDSTLLNNLIASGMIARDPLFDEHANAPGLVGAMNLWNDLDNSGEPNYSQDDESTGTPDKVTQKELKVRAVHLNNGWKASDLARELQTGEDAMQRIRNRVDHYWDVQLQKRMIASIEGMMADNVANDSNDMVNDISLTGAGTPGASNFFSRQAFTNTVFSLGDHYDDILAVACHSTILQNMVDADDIEFIPDSLGRLSIPTYMGRRVIVDDTLVRDDPDDPGSAVEYITCFFGTGSFAFGSGTPEVPTEVERNASQGNGGGNEVLWSRKTWLIQPYGFSFLGNTLTDADPDYATLANLKAANNWDRIVTDRKSIPMSFLISNG